MNKERLNNLFRERLRTIREKKGITQSELARRIGKTPSYVCDVERGRRIGITLATLALFAAGLDISPAKLVEKKP